ncbi:Methylcrotonoyl-CoA carboxylase beta chain, mitochondrial [Varanus komodoensis]|nr:Methylcrotonoyl-CoA carboxylase beta chain, mitochondrial [Varanus komodoensis]
MDSMAFKLFYSDYDSMISGCVDHFASSEKEAYECVRNIISTLNYEIPLEETSEFDSPLYSSDELLGLAPQGYSYTLHIKLILSRMIDGSRFQEFKANYGTTLVTGFAYIEGQLVGVVANNGELTHDASLKGSHFVQLCSQRRIPVLFLLNTAPCAAEPTSLTEAEDHSKRLKAQASMMAAVACASVPKITLVIGGCYGNESYAMISQLSDTLPLRDKVRSLGVLLDPELSLEAQVTAVARNAFLQLRLINQLRPYLEYDCLATVTHALVTSRLDFCNALYVGLPLKTVRTLQLVQNRAARLLTGTGRYTHMTPVPRQLHWLPIEARAQFKVLIMTYKALNGLGPGYLNERLRPYMPDRPLRSAGESLLREPSMKEIRRCGRSFDPNFLFLWPNTRIALVDSRHFPTVSFMRDNDSTAAEADLILLKEKLEEESSAFYSSARIWDDGVILPQNSRKVIAQCLRITKQQKYQIKSHQQSPLPVIRL